MRLEWAFAERNVDCGCVMRRLRSGCGVARRATLCACDVACDRCGFMQDLCIIWRDAALYGRIYECGAQKCMSVEKRGRIYALNGSFAHR